MPSCLRPGVARASRASGRVDSPFPPWPEGQGLAPSADGRGPSRAVALHAGEWTRPGGRTARRRAGDAGASPASGSQQSRLSHPHGGDEAVATGDRGRHANSAGVGWRAVARYRHLYGERAGRGTNKAVALTSIWWVGGSGGSVPTRRSSGPVTRSHTLNLQRHRVLVRPSAFPQGPHFQPPNRLPPCPETRSLVRKGRGSNDVQPTASDLQSC